MKRRDRGRWGSVHSLGASLGVHGLFAVLCLGWVAVRAGSEAAGPPDAVIRVAEAREPVEFPPPPEEREPLPEVAEPEEPEPPAEVPEPRLHPVELAEPPRPPARPLPPSADPRWLARPLAPRPAPAAAEPELESAPAEPLPASAAASAPPAAPETTTVTARGPVLVSGPRPAYPRASVRRQEEGEVLCRLFVAADGSVERVEVIARSGYPRLDAAACEALARWSFRAATEDGRAVPSELDHRVVFRLTDG